MNKKFLSFLLIIVTIISAKAQNSLPKTNSTAYEELKHKGLLPSDIVISNTHTFTPSLEDFKKLGITHQMHQPGNPPTPASSSNCSCYTSPDNTYTLAMTPNDDFSTGLLTIPFTFCLYGTNYTNLYVNNNGNISFVNSYGTFSSSSFPDPSYIMVAPFWADVDTRGTGSVYYKITATAMYVNWSAVGYYSSAIDKINSFQLIITDGNDPILPAGNNIAFCYGDMQWTTGAASGGTNGFAGTPATVGINKGDGVSYVQLGRFDQPGTSYDGGYGNNDGVSWLDNKSFYFNACSGTNLAPIASGINDCDTLKMCGVGDTLIFDGLFLSPEIGQNTTITVNPNGTSGVTVLNNTSGNTASTQIMIVSGNANAGNHVITLTATDNGTPAGITTVNVNVYVDIASTITFFPVIIGNQSICPGDSALLSVSPTNYDSYTWNTGSSSTAIYADTAGQYWVTSSYNGCYRTNFINVQAQTSPVAAIAPNLGICSGDSITLTASGVGTYYWYNSSDTTDTIRVSPAISTTYTVQVQNNFGCKDTATATVEVYSSPIAAFTFDSLCLNESMKFTDVSIFTGGTITAWSWDFGDTSPASTIQNPSHPYLNTGTYPVALTITTNNGCIAADTQNVIVHPLPNVQFSAGSGCVGSLMPFIDLSSIPAPDQLQFWSWNYGDGSPLNNNRNTTHQYSATGLYQAQLLVVSNFGCRDSITHIAAVTPPLAVNFTTSDTVGCNPFCIDFQNLYITPPGHHATYFWEFGDNTPYDTASNPHHCFVNNSLTTADSFNISLTVTPDTGCVTTYTKNNYIIVNPSPIAEFELNPNPASILFPVVSFTNLTQGGSSWNWDLGDLTTSTDSIPMSHTYADTGHYTVTLIATNQFSCKDTAIHIEIIKPDWCLYIPNSFSPNGNGINDKFQGYGFGIKKYEMTIFDRWGNQIYHTTDYNQPWDGKSNHTSDKVEMDVYIYLFEIIDPNDIYHSYRGTVTVAR